MIDISIIVPAYNAENYIRKCLDSLVVQTKRNIEIIAINDGSKDNTLGIINEYAEKYTDLIKVISQENQGLSVTRNNGIKAASGKYIAFCDSDDYVKSDMYETMFNKASEKDYDIVVCGSENVYPDKVVEVGHGVKIESAKLTIEQKKELFLDMYVVAWNKLLKKELFDDGDLFFEPGIWFEDVLFSHKLITKIKSIAYVDNSFYEYVQRPNSITYTYSDKLFDIHFVMNSIVEYYKDKGLFEEYKQELEYMYVRYMFATYIKRLSKSKDRKRFKAGVAFARKVVKEAFPDYKKNYYLNNGGMKNIYLKHFNSIFADMIYFVEKNRMN